MPLLFIDIHTHSSATGRQDVIAVKNIFQQNTGDIQPDKGWFSYGLHPWDSGSITINTDLFDAVIRRPEILAVGECGLDRLRGAGLVLQGKVFRHQAQIAEIHQKPVIIHCVRAWQEILALKNDLRPAAPWIIHGFRGKPELADRLIDNGFYLSFGESLLILKDSASGVFKNTPANRFFLETDESKYTIEDIYFAACRIKNLSLEGLQQCMLQNFETVFGIHGTSGMATTH